MFDLRHISFVPFFLSILFCLNSCTNNKTKINRIVECGDFLSRWVEKPEELEFTGCRYLSKSSQVIATASYRVKGEHSVIVENHFVKNHKMGKLKIFPHTGWEPNGYGWIDVSELKKINEYCGLLIEMWGPARKKDESDLTLLPREEVPYFFVYVKVAII